MVAPAADEMDYLQAVAFGKLGLWPLLARDDVVVKFDGDSIGFHSHVFDERREGQGRVKIAGFTIDFDFHCSSHSSLRRRNLRVAVRPA